MKIVQFVKMSLAAAVIAASMMVSVAPMASASEVQVRDCCDNCCEPPIIIIINTAAVPTDDSTRTDDLVVEEETSEIMPAYMKLEGID